MGVHQSSANLSVVHSVPFWLPLTATWLYNQVRYMPALIKNHVVCMRTENLDQFKVQRIFSLDMQPRSRYYLDRLFRKRTAQRYSEHLQRVARKTGAAILHSHWGESAWRDITAAKALRVPHVVTFYGKDVNYYPRQHANAKENYKRLFEHAAQILCEGPHMAECIVKLGCCPAKVLVHHLGVDVKNISFQPRQWDGAAPLRVLIAASFREKKGIPFALEALGRFRKELSYIEITIIGDASGDPRSQAEKKKILEVIERYDLRTCTRLLGYQNHVGFFREAYRNHVFISPSITAHDGDTEGGAPVSLIEIAATGMPIISTTHCDIPSVILHGKTGLLAPERDVDSLVQYLRWLVSHVEFWPEMLSAGRRHVETEYDVVKQTTKLSNIYQVLHNRNAQ
jgi:colanic acid/amylovoran biosynthesis glycosyltransferase